MHSYSKIYLKGNVFILVSDLKNVVLQAIKTHKLDNIQALTFASAIATFAPLSRLQKSNNSSTSIVIKSEMVKNLTIESKNNGDIRAFFDFVPTTIDQSYFSDFSTEQLVSSYVGKKGILSIVNTNNKSNYGGQVELVSGDFITDLAHYFNSSQQIKSAIKNKVFLGKTSKQSVVQSVIFQLLPNYQEEDIIFIENILKDLKTHPDIHSYFNQYTPISIKKWRWKCQCVEKGFDNLLKLLDESEVDKIIKKNKQIEITCQYCNQQKTYKKEDWRLAKAPFSLSSVESLTGGYFASKIVSQAGASSFYKGSIIAYSNEIKEKLGIDTSKGVVNAQVVLAMAKAGNKFFKTKYCFAFSGNAGPKKLDGEIGQVFVALNDKVWELKLKGSRKQIIQKTTNFALKQLQKIQQ
ncbi:competence/damage-inducible protein CinA [Mesomycoplasma conjunctivae]|uniref:HYPOTHETICAL 33 kDa chaperonin n=1 Tax=Mesomycoplasma conjunctivae (strain ATCC 25834 / NCTC 10147 / HRC/581) TaxID=572263 RepID=C5J5K4_MESCH|nr:Hsp33 family molecular chaperone HslO [Mesomycoplasma conjunctivae]CAT04727.1 HYPOTHETICAL 33 kDa chaperonin [Mesomycoplasma conjunctivae]VEU65731.1 competence/damage-inducible protein CinA [Mesomycoplasma conjunctivae]